MDNQASIHNKPARVISGTFSGQRVESRVLEEQIQDTVARGDRSIEVRAFGQHGIGGRLWRSANEPVHVKITGHTGQRVGSMGFPNTFIEVLGPASDDVGWLNAGAEIVIHGNAGNGCANAMAQGKIFIAGNIGARGMTMTKHNPRFAPPELWLLGSAGDYFGEFMAGGIAVICGHEAQNPQNVLGYRPFVGAIGPLSEWLAGRFSFVDRIVVTASPMPN
jgi:glutamate synthase domain-containing protein 3